MTSELRISNSRPDERLIPGPTLVYLLVASISKVHEWCILAAAMAIMNDVLKLS